VPILRIDGDRTPTGALESAFRRAVRRQLPRSTCRSPVRRGARTTLDVGTNALIWRRYLLYYFECSSSSFRFVLWALGPVRAGFSGFVGDAALARLRSARASRGRRSTQLEPHGRHGVGDIVGPGLGESVTHVGEQVSDGIDADRGVSLKAFAQGQEGVRRRGNRLSRESPHWERALKIDDLERALPMYSRGFGSPLIWLSSGLGPFLALYSEDCPPPTALLYLARPFSCLLIPSRSERFG